MSELSEQELAEIDLAVGKMERLDVKYNTYNGRIRVIRTIIYDPPDPLIGKFDECVYQPTSDPAEAMRLLEKYGLLVGPGIVQDMWECELPDRPSVACEIGQTPCIAIARAVIAIGSAK